MITTIMTSKRTLNIEHNAEKDIDVVYGTGYISITINSNGSNITADLTTITGDNTIITGDNT